MVPVAGATVVVVITVGDGAGEGVAGAGEGVVGVGAGVVGVGVVGVVGVGVVGAAVLGTNTCVASATIGTFSAYVSTHNLYGL